jgi:Spy/CpxP family protein refolding chaperone
MKKFNRLSAIVLTGLFLFIAANSIAQKGQGFNGRGMNKFDGPRFKGQCQMLPDLTDEQQEQIKDLRVDQMKQMTRYRNNLMEKRATLRKLQTQENPDMDAINNIIEEMGNIRTEMYKDRAEHHQEIREILTEEQRAVFDARMGKPHRMAGRNNNCPRMGRGFGFRR